MDVILEVFDVIRSAAKTGPGTALLRPFDGTLFIDYTPQDAKLYAIIRGKATLLVQSDWDAYSPRLMASYELAWLSSDGLTQTLFETLEAHPADTQHLMRPIVQTWVMNKFWSEVCDD